MTKYRVVWEPSVSRHYDNLALYKLTMYGTTQSWEYVRDFKSLDEAEQWQFAMTRRGDIAMEFEV